MSSKALAAFWRHEFDPPLDGTAAAILLYFAIRHDEELDAAYPGLKKICKDLSMSRGRVVEGISRLEKKFGVIDINRGAGIRRTNLYKLPWIRQGGSAGPDRKGSAGPDRAGGSAGPDREGSVGADPGGVRRTDERCQVEPSKPVRPARPKNNKTIKQSQDREAKPLSDTAVHEIANDCIQDQISHSDGVRIVTKANDRGYDIKPMNLKRVQSEIKKLCQKNCRR